MNTLHEKFYSCTVTPIEARTPTGTVSRTFCACCSAVTSKLALVVGCSFARRSPSSSVSAPSAASSLGMTGYPGQSQTACSLPGARKLWSSQTCQAASYFAAHAAACAPNEWNLIVQASASLNSAWPHARSMRSHASNKRHNSPATSPHPPEKFYCCTVSPTSCRAKPFDSMSRGFVVLGTGVVPSRVQCTPASSRIRRFVTSRAGTHALRSACGGSTTSGRDCGCLVVGTAQHVQLRCDGCRPVGKLGVLPGKGVLNLAITKPRVRPSVLPLRGPLFGGRLTRPTAQIDIP
jgi:hypothetical protein